MGKHNGKARKAGLTVGKALVSAAKKEGKTGSAAAYLHTTDVKQGNTMQSVLESNDLVEMMSMAELAERDFTADRGEAVVVSTGAVEAIDIERAEEERREAERRSAHRLRIPRRPQWSPSTTPDELETAERSSFLEWRRDLAAIEQDERLVLTPFEKNLEVWRQLWRVIERSDVVVQVLDARDPLTYRSEDLEKYCRELQAHKSSILLLNKADLLPEKLRSAWADYFDRQQVVYFFWSAKAASEAQQLEKEGLPVFRPICKDRRAVVLSTDELLDALEAEAKGAAAEARVLGLPRASRGDRLIVGLTGYPNVGKSSTINALFGEKKTAVAATPGKTKHFQTLNVSETMCLCDCPGLVMPQFARSKAEMVAAGVIPIDRLTDIRAPVGAVAVRVRRSQLERVYGLHLPPPPVDEPQCPPSASELLRAFALSRGWVAASGLPDETKAGRRILKDYVDGKILACRPPPDASADVVALAESLYEWCPTHDEAHCADSDGDSLQSENATEENDRDDYLDPADLDLLEGIAAANNKNKALRAAHKFQKKAARIKKRGQTVDTSSGDGAAILQGKRGGVVRVAGYY